MAITLVQSAHASAISGGNVQVTLGSNTTAGNCLVVVTYTEFSQPTVTLTGSSDTFTHQLGAGDGATASNFIDLYTDSGCSGGHNTVNVAFGSATAVYAIVYEFSGLYTTGVLDKTASTTHSSPTTTSWSSGTTAATTVANELWFGAVVGSAHAPTGPSSPWVNAASGALADAANVLTGYDIVSSTGTATYSGTFGTADIYGALVVTLKGAVTSTGSASLNKMAMAGTETETFTSTGATSLSSLAMAGTAVAALPFPANVLNAKIELLLNGTWTDITQYVYQRDPITITGRGRADETTSAQPSGMTLTLNNRNGQFTPKNSGSVFYPYITRNTQIRVSVATASSTGVIYSGYRFYGEVSSWPVLWDPTGADVYVQLSASGILRRLNQNSAPLGYPVDRYVSAALQGVDSPLALWPATDASGSTQFASSLPGGSAMTITGTPNFAADNSFAGSGAFAQLNGSSWSGTPFAYSTTGVDTYATPGSYIWSCPPGITSAEVQCWGAGSGGSGGEAHNPTGSGGGGGGGGGEFAQETTVTVVPGDSYVVTVGPGGSANNGIADNGGTSSFSGPSATTVTAHGGTIGNTFVSIGSGGTGSTNTIHHDGGSGGDGSANEGGGGGGSSAGTSAAGNNGSPSSGNTGGAGGSAPTGGGAGGTGATRNTSPAPNVAVVGGGGGGGDGWTYNGANGGAGKVVVTYASGSVPYANVLRFCLDIPAAGGVNGAIYAQFITGGTVNKVNVIYGTGGTLQVIGYNSGGSALFTSTAAGAYNGVPVIVSVELTPSGTSLAWALKTIPAGKAQTATTVASGTLATTSVGQVTAVNVNPGGTETGAIGIGHVILQHYVTSLPDLAYAVSGYDNELAADRFTRICGEAGVTATLVGVSTDTPAMGPQANDTLVNVLQSVENLDCGLLYESRNAFGLSYRTRVSMQNQSVVLPLDYSAAEVGTSSAGLAPTYDDQYIRNDVTITRQSGSSARVSDTSGSMSISDPPNGVGDYAYSRTVYAHADSQLANQAQWLLDLGTVDDERYPQIPLDLSRSELANLLATAAGMDIGDFVQITNMPTFMGESSTSQLAWGLAETINAYIWQITVNAVPEVPYANAVNDDPNFTIGSWLASQGTVTIVPVSSAPVGYPTGGSQLDYAGKYVNNGVSAGAMEDGNGSGVYFTASPSTAYQADAWVYSSDTSVQIGFNWYDSGGTYISTTATSVSVSANTWTRISSGSRTSASTAARGIIRVGTASASGGTVYAMNAIAYLVTDALPSW